MERYPKLKNVWAFRTYVCDAPRKRIFAKLVTALPEDVLLVLAWNSKSDSDQSQLPLWREFFSNYSRHVEIVTLPDDELKQKYPVYQGAWQHGQIHIAEIGARLSFDFEHIWLSDHDIDFSGDFAAFWKIVRNDPRDHLTTQVRHYELEPEWAWWAVTPPNRRLWKSFLPIIRCSRRLLQHLEKLSTSGVDYFCEAMLPGETVIQFGELAIGELPVTTFQHKHFRYHPPLTVEERRLIETTEHFRWWHPVKE